MKTDVDRLDIGKLETTPVDLSKLSDVQKVKFNENCLRQDSISFIHGNAAHLYITYKLHAGSRELHLDFT